MKSTKFDDLVVKFVSSLFPAVKREIMNTRLTAGKLREEIHEWKVYREHMLYELAGRRDAHEQSVEENEKNADRIKELAGENLDMRTELDRLKKVISRARAELFHHECGVQVRKGIDTGEDRKALLTGKADIFTWDDWYSASDSKITGGP